MTIDATIAGASANSYLTVADADAFAGSELGDDAKAWLSATVETKEAALQRATADVDQEIGRVAYPWSTTQALVFPRTLDLATDGVTLILPARLRRAVYVQAAFLVNSAPIIDRAAAMRARGLANFSNPDGTSGQLADADTGWLHPRARRLLGEFTEGAVIATIIPT